MTSLHVGVDIDDVLFPWYVKAHAASEAAGITNGVTPSSWSPYNEYGCTDQEWFAALADVTLDGSLYSGEPFPGAADALGWIMSAGHKVHLITARGFLAHGEMIRRATIDWLAEHSIPHDSLTFVQEKTQFKTDIFIDDVPKHVIALADAGSVSYLMSAPHNQSFDWDRRVEDMHEFAADVIAIGHNR